MTQEINKVELSNLPLTDNGSLKVELIAMSSGNDPWRTLGDYKSDQRRATIQFWFAICSAASAIVTSIVAVFAIVNITP